MLKDKLNIIRHCGKKATKENNHLEMIRQIGQGTFGKVYLVWNNKTNKKQAMKEVLQDPKYKNRELAVISQLDHPNIIEMKEYFFKVVNGQCILNIVMDYMDTSLHSMLKQQQKIKIPVPSKIRKMLSFQLFKGLYYLHINNICHRDLKPHNLLINTSNCQLKICDFGSAKIIQTKENNVSYICSRYYRAPELILNSTTYGCQIDMWSAGCIMVEFLTLQPIFPGDSSIEQLIEIIKLIGTPSKMQLATFSSQNAAVDLPKVNKSDLAKILERYNPLDSQIDLIKQILTYEIENRLTPYQALTHPYFSDLASFQQSRRIPLLFDFQSMRGINNKKQIDMLEDLYQSLITKYKKSNEKDAELAVSVFKSNNI